MKKLVKSYLVEIYEVDNTIVLDKNEVKEKLTKIIKTSAGTFSSEKIKKLLDKRYKEIEDYYNGNLPHNKEKRNETNKLEKKTH